MDKSNKVKKFTAQGSWSLQPRQCCEWYLPRLPPTVINWERNDRGRLVPGTLPLDKSDEGSFIWKK